MTGPILAQLKDIRLSLGGGPLFTGVDIAVRRGERACLVGPNGAGKSTLLRILAGTAEADAGERAVAQNVAIAVVDQEPDLRRFATLRDYACSPLAGRAPTEAHLAEAALHRYGLDPERSPQGMSGGEVRRASIARALAAEPDLLLLDEPTNHLDIATITLLEEEVAGFHGGLLLISHDRRFLERVTRTCYWLRNGRVLAADVGFKDFEPWAEAIELGEERALSRLETQLKAEERWLQRGVTARRSRNEGRRRKLLSMRAERRERKGVLQASAAKAGIAADAGSESGRLVIEAKGLTKSFPGQAAPVVSGLDLRIMRGDRVGLVGPNGSGKTTLLQLLLGRLAPDAGSIRHGVNLEIAYVDQARALLNEDATIWETLAPGGGDQVMVRGHPKHVAAYARDFLFSPAQLKQPAGALSGGERNRLALAVTLARPANLLVLDEPTNDLDMDTLDVLEDAVASYEGTVLIVSHDRAFLDAATTQVVGALGGGRWAETPGGYADFEREHGGYTPPRVVRAVPKPSAPGPEAPKIKRKLSYKEERRLAEVERRLPELEAEIARLEADMADPALYAADTGRYALLAAKLEAARHEKDQCETDWLVLEELRAALNA